MDEAVAAARFDGVEIFENDLLTFEGTPADVRKAARDLGLEIAIFQPFRDFEAMPEPQRARNMDRAERKFDVMQALGTDLLLVCSNTQPHSLDDDARAAAEVAVHRGVEGRRDDEDETGARRTWRRGRTRSSRSSSPRRSAPG